MVEDTGIRRRPSRNSKSRRSRGDGSSQGNTKSRVRLFRGISPCGVQPKCPGKSSLGNPASLDSIGVDSRSVLGKRQTIRASGYNRESKKGGRLTELLSDDYALKNGA